ncbi:hypothetical protein ACFL12_09070, partial [Pseudomonadota bacterium]
MAFKTLTWQSPLRGLGVTTVCIAVLAACAPPSKPPVAHQGAPSHVNETAYADDSLTREMFRIGLKGISQRYITPREIDEIALSGMRGLAAIDPSLQVQFEEGEAHLYAHGEAVAAYPLPNIDNPALWANLTLDVVRAARLH